MNGLLIALQFLTRLPIPARRTVAESQLGTAAESQLGTAARWFPLVGGLIGCLVGGVDIGVSGFVSPELRAIGSVIAFAALTGALHLDGLMDACDGLLSVTTPTRRLEIMQDSRVGSFGVVGAATLLLLKYAAFLALPAQTRLVSFLAVGGISRWAMVLVAQKYPAARPAGLAHAFRSGIRERDLAIATGIVLLIVAPAGLAGLVSLLAGGLAATLLARYTLTKIPGLTGDVYGGICEIVEVVVALVLPPLWRLTGQ